MKVQIFQRYSVANILREMLKWFNSAVRDFILKNQPYVLGSNYK